MRDEVFHMNYTYTQLARISPRSYRRQVWLARRAGKREPQGWAPVSARADARPTSQY